MRVSSNCNPHTLLSEVQNGTATLENSRFFSLRYIYFVLSPFSHVQFFVTLWNVDCHAPLSMGFSKQEYWSELPCPPPGDLPGPGIEPTSLVSLAQAGGFFTTAPPGKPIRVTGTLIESLTISMAYFGFNRCKRDAHLISPISCEALWGKAPC